MLNRRALLSGGAAALAGAGAGGVLAAARGGGAGQAGLVAATGAAVEIPAHTPGTPLPLVVVNHTYRYANREIWFYVVGTDLSTGRQVYGRPDGGVTEVAAGVDGADIAIPLAADGDTVAAIPVGMSGRIYVSIGARLDFRVVADGAGRPALQYPAGWVRDAPGYAVLHDFVEFTHNAAGMFCNTTMVDMFSVPLLLRLHGDGDQTTGRVVPGGRDAIFAALRAIPAFAPLVVDDLRVIAPGHGIDAGLFPAAYYDSYVDAVWSRYASRPLAVDAAGRRVTGRVVGDTLTFDGPVASFARPSSRDVFFCDGALGAPNDGVTGPVAAVLGAGFNRSTLLADAAQPTADPAVFYRDTVTNHYARVLHAHTDNGRAYGFAFDDVGGQASYVEDRAPSQLTFVLTPF
ncbi:glycosyl hydrolase [Frankia sp. CNm7]|uniref:Glycosyl hydrolase n=1 Tax=Frankia nepalensis TaxID=1836974 RepID=A0A937USN5_9ACTN|nr:beta-1,3-glucanase family protein [Frankia nepalensis]MBL7498089.1 glycosyl hydrolase [Frankia nepalensis]MBL7509295.1 glycosyl hydrolase [Frankia nepalensis]MBL7522087.1 glycosyl hydrolase [Frankia nepalensis]MBL7629071.1 glycosyl hydrolase [Frankia nepalensis]